MLIGMLIRSAAILLAPGSVMTCQTTGNDPAAVPDATRLVADLRVGFEEILAIGMGDTAAQSRAARHAAHGSARAVPVRPLPH